MDKSSNSATSSDHQSDSRSRAALPGKDPAKILIVDDSATDREFLAYLLRHSHYRVFEAADGAEAVRLATAERPDLVICDVLLPLMDGYEFVRRLRADPSTAGLTVIFYSAVFNEGEARNLALDCGVSLILSKPTEPKKILRTVSEMLRAAGAQDIDARRDVPENFQVRHHQLLSEKLLEQTEALRMSEDRFRLLAEHAADMIFSLRLKPARVWEYVNPASKMILGYSPSEFYEDPELLFKAVHPDSREELLNYMGERSGAGNKTCNIRFFHKEGKVVWTGISVTGVCDDAGNVVALEGIARDISERMEMNEEICKSRDDLELRVLERTAELAKANEVLRAEINERERVETELQHYMGRLEESNRALRDFSSIASHDLQEPLRKVISFGNLLQEKFGPSIGEQGKDYLRRMVDATRRMQSLLTALLEYSRLLAAVDPFVQVRLSDIIAEVLSDLEVRIERSGGKVHAEDLPVIHADPTQMRQLFQNLISNALKFHEEGTGPVIRIHSAIRDRTIRIFVEDNGIGFEEQHLEKIFAPFQRLHGRSSPYKGTGMGLTICKKIVERHGGAITATSAPGKGSTFILTLPVRQNTG